MMFCAFAPMGFIKALIKQNQTMVYHSTDFLEIIIPWVGACVAIYGKALQTNVSFGTQKDQFRFLIDFVGPKRRKPL